MLGWFLISELLILFLTQTSRFNFVRIQPLTLRDTRVLFQIVEFFNSMNQNSQLLSDALILTILTSTLLHYSYKRDENAKL